MLFSKNLNPIIAKKSLFQKQEKNKIFIILLFLISPVLSLFVAIKNYRTEWAKDIVWLFVAFYGFTMVISHEGMDASYYRDSLYSMARTEITFNNFLSTLFNEETSYLDFIQPLITFIVSRFTSDHKVLFLIFALLFGYFYTRNIWFIIEKVDLDINKNNLPFVITFAFVIGFWEINGFRMWTAAHIFFFGASQYIIGGNKKGLWITIGSLFVHFSFLLPVILILIHGITKKHVHIIFWIYISTFFVVEIDLGVINESISNLAPSFFTNRVQGYTNDDYAKAVVTSVQGNNWYALYYGRALNWVIVVFMITIYIRGISFVKRHYSLLSLYSFTLLFLAVANLVSLIPSGGRFVIVASLFAIFTIVIYIKYAPKDRFVTSIILLSLPAILLYCVVRLRMGFDTIGVVTLMGNPLIAMVVDIDIALIELIK